MLGAVKILIKPKKEEKEEMLSSYNEQINVQRNENYVPSRSYMLACSNCEIRDFFPVP